jgi:hypothetical protein
MHGKIVLQFRSKRFFSKNSVKMKVDEKRTEEMMEDLIKEKKHIDRSVQKFLHLLEISVDHHFHQGSHHKQENCKASRDIFPVL